MMCKRKVEDYILYLAIGSLYAFALNLSILATTVVAVSTWSLFVVGTSILLFFCIVFWNKYTMLATLGVLVLVGVVAFLSRNFQYLEGFWYFVNEMLLLTQGYLVFRAEFAWPITLIICLLTGLFIAVCLYVNFHFYMLTGLGAFVFVISWLMNYPQSLVGFIIYLFCFCVFLVYKLQGKTREGARTALIAAPLCALIVWASTIIPVPSTSLESDAINRFFNEPWGTVSEFVFLTFNPKYFSFQTTGFGGHGGRLGGPVFPNNRPVMAVDAERRVYLSGATHNIYTGYGWMSDTSEFVPMEGRIHPSYIEFMETAHALFMETSRLELTGNGGYDLRLVSYLPLSNVDIFIGNNRTGSLFRPMRDRGVQFDNPALNDMLLVNASGDMQLKELLPRNSAYRFNFLDLDYREEHIQTMLRTSRTGMYRERIMLSNLNPDYRKRLLFDIWHEDIIVGEATIEQITTNVHRVNATWTAGGTVNTISHFVHDSQLSLERWDIEGFDRLIDSHTYIGGGLVEIFDHFDLQAAITMVDMLTGVGKDVLLAEYADFVYANYMALPYTLPQRVIDLAHDITRYYHTNYDRIRALQEFLIQFPYTLSPNPVPIYRDFVDYFLFDGQEGYCVYYASAMVVMSRAIGIPARYAEGFLLPAQRDQYTGMFTVTNRNAHAWAEIYFEGFGWLVVESTAPYVYAMYERPFFASTNIFALDFMDWAQEEYLRQMGLWYAVQGAAVNLELDEDLQYILGLDTTTTEQITVNLWVLALYVAAAFLGIIVIYFAVWHILWGVRLYKLKCMDAKGCVIYYYKEIIGITDYWKYPLLENETTYVYSHRMKRRFSFANDTIFLRDLNEIYYRAKYGKDTIKEEEAAFMKECYYELAGFVRATRGSHTFWYIRYVKGVATL